MNKETQRGQSRQEVRGLQESCAGPTFCPQHTESQQCILGCSTLYPIPPHTQGRVGQGGSQTPIHPFQKGCAGYTVKKNQEACLLGCPRPSQGQTQSPGWAGQGFFHDR